MLWLFKEKNDSNNSDSSRLVLDGSRMKPGRDYDLAETYVSAAGIKMTLIISASYKLRMRKADVNGAYLGAPNKPKYTVFVHIPQGYQRIPGPCLQVTGNINGAPDAGYFFDTDLSDIIALEMDR